MKKIYIILPIILLMLIGAYQFAFSSSATQVEMFLDGVTDPNTFAPASSGVVYTYSAGTTSNKTVWTDRGKTAAAQNPFTLNSMGQAQVYGAGIYKFVIKDAVGGTTLYTYDNISVGTVQGPWTDVSEYASLTAAVTAIGAVNNTTLLISGTTTLTANTTVTDNITLLHKSPGLITCGTYTLLINGPIDAGLSKIFDSTCGSGDVSLALGSSAEVYPDWFGAEGDGTTDDLTAYTTTFAAAAAGATVVWHGTPLTSGSITIPPKIRFVAVGSGGIDTTHRPATYFIKKSTMTTPALRFSGNGIVMVGGGVVGQVGNTGDNIYVIGNSHTLEGVYSELAGQDGFRFGDDAGLVNTNSWKATRCTAYGNVRHGFKFSHGTSPAGPDVNGGVASANTSRNNGGDGYYIGNADLNLFSGNLGEENTGCGIRFTTSEINTLISGDYEGNIEAQIKLEPGTTNTFIHGIATGVVTDNSAAATSKTTRRPDRYIVSQGTWTPVLSASVTAGTNSYSTQNGYWQRVGEMVYIQGRLTMTAKDATMDGNVTITGFPIAYSATYTGAFSIPAIGQWDNITLPTGATQLVGRIAAGATSMALMGSGTITAAATILATGISNTTQIMFQAIYPVSGTSDY